MVTRSGNPSHFGALNAALMLLPLAIFGLGCWKGSANFQRAQVNAIATAQNNPNSAHFRAMFPVNRAFLRGLERTNTPPAFIIEGIVHGRYLITMVMPLTVDRLTFRVLAVGPPSFILKEFKTFEKTSGGGYHARFLSLSQKHFGIQEWQMLVDGGGNLSVLGIEPITNKPIAGVEFYLGSDKRN